MEHDEPKTYPARVNRIINCSQPQCDVFVLPNEIIRVSMVGGRLCYGTHMFGKGDVTLVATLNAPIDHAALDTEDDALRRERRLERQ